MALWLGLSALSGSPVGVCAARSRGTPAWDFSAPDEGKKQIPAEPAAMGRTTPAASALTQRAGGMRGAQQRGGLSSVGRAGGSAARGAQQHGACGGLSSVLPSPSSSAVAGNWGCPRYGAHAGKQGSSPNPPQSCEPGAGFYVLLLKTGNREGVLRGSDLPRGTDGCRCRRGPGDAAQPPSTATARMGDPDERTRCEGLAGSKHSPCNGLPKYLLEYFIISEGGKPSPA